MNKIRRFAYAALLAFTTLNITPGRASAQETARGRFTLTHDVRWQNAVVPAGDYRFSLAADGPSSVLTLSKLDGRRAGFLLVVHDTDTTPTGPSRLVLENMSDGTYVSALQLPEFGLTLHFTVPTPEKQIAKAETSAATATR